MASTRTELAQLAGQVAAVEAAHRIRAGKGQPETLITIAGALIGLLDGREIATVGLAVTSFAKTLVASAEGGVK